MEKNLRLRSDQIKKLVRRMGVCLASDGITVKGRKVGFMYREEPDHNQESGWRFLAGDESQEYLDNPKNMEIYDVNTIANYDSAIIPYLEAPTFSAFERNPNGGFHAVEMPAEIKLARKPRRRQGDEKK